MYFFKMFFLKSFRWVKFDTSRAALVAICFIVCVSNLCNVEAGAGSELKDDTDILTMTLQEKKGLDKLKSKVLNHLTEYYMRTDYYLIRWLRMADLDVGKATEMIMENIKWRQRANISSILDDDFSDVAEDYHMTFGEESRDKWGRPVGTIDLGDWDLRGAIVQGKRPRLQRYLLYALERGMHSLMFGILQSPSMISSGTVLIDGDGGNVRQHLCAQCLGILGEWIWTMEHHYPRGFKEMIVINAPPITAMGLQILKPIMSQDTKTALKVFDNNKKVWMAYLDERISRDQRTVRYGGTRPDS